MAHSLGNPMLLSPPCEVVFSGFRARLHDLQRQGWQVAMDEVCDPEYRYRNTMNMRLRHAKGHMAATAVCRNYERALFLSRREMYETCRPEPLLFEVVSFGSDVVVERHSDIDFHLVDALPSYTMTTTQVSVYDMPVFRHASQSVGEELIVDPATVSELLEQIHRMQEPGQKEIRERARRREVLPTAVASILAFPKAA